jgi:hypothetical protein
MNTHSPDNAALEGVAASPFIDARDILNAVPAAAEAATRRVEQLAGDQVTARPTKKMKLGDAASVAGSATLAQYLDSHDAPGTKEVAVFICALDTERITNGKPLPFNSAYLAACRVCGLRACFVLVCSN